MELIRSTAAMQAWAAARRTAGERLGLVPTMGALHEGHLALVDAAVRRVDRVVVSIFVNPTQFAPNEDFGEYPRSLETDLAQLSERGGVSVVFAPSIEDLYPDGADENVTWVVVKELDRYLCGATRDGHFQGVTTVVARLLNICRPHVAVFGRKDAQQFFIIKRLVRDLFMDVEVIGVPTVREQDGLALSSRNQYLSPEERKQAVVLSRALSEAHRLIAGGEQEVEAVVRAMRRLIAQAPLADVQYAEVVDTNRLQRVAQIRPGQEVLVAVAVFFGKTRLIDNVIVGGAPDG